MADSVRQSAERRVIEKAWKDEGFRKKLLEDPRGAVGSELGVALPAHVKIQIVEEDADTFVLVIPKKADAPPSGKMSAQDLESVAGGWDTDTIFSCGCTQAKNTCGAGLSCGICG